MKEEALREDEVLLDLGEGDTYGFEMPDETQAKKADTKVKSQMTPAVSDAPPDEGTVVQDATAKKWATKLKAAKEALQACHVDTQKANAQLAKLKGGSGNKAKDKALEKQLSDANSKLAAEEANKQMAIKSAVDAAKVEDEKAKDKELKDQENAMKQKEDTAVKKAMTLSDAEKQEMAQNKKLASELGKEKTKL